MSISDKELEGYDDGVESRREVVSNARQQGQTFIEPPSEDVEIVVIKKSSSNIEELKPHFNDALKRVSIIVGAGLILIMFTARGWFMNVLLGYEQIDLSKGYLVTDNTPKWISHKGPYLKHVEDQVGVDPGDVSWYEATFCRSLKVARNCFRRSEVDPRMRTIEEFKQVRNKK